MSEALKVLILEIQKSCKDAGSKFSVEIFCEGRDKEAVISFGPTIMPKRQFMAGFKGLDDYAKRIAESAAKEAARLKWERAEIVNVRFSDMKSGDFLTNFALAMV